MTVTGRLSALMALCALSIGTSGVWAQAQMPQGEFVCHVQDAAGATRFVGVQANTLGEAQDIVQGKSKWVVPAGLELVECINPDTQTFKSRKAQKQYGEELR